MTQPILLIISSNIEETVFFDIPRFQILVALIILTNNHEHTQENPSESFDS